MPQPSAAEQVKFLRNLQRLLDEGQFVATYKFALLLALADLSVEMGEDSDAELELPVSAIAEKFLSMYWSHTLPYPTSGAASEAVLSQNQGRNIAVLGKIAEFRSHVDSLAQARKSRNWKKLLKATAQIVQVMPLLRLQTLRGAGDLTFIYPNRVADGAIRLLPGVAYHFRQFHGLVQHVVRGAWVRHVRSNPRNGQLLGETADLEEFLFGSSRAQYPQLKKVLLKLQNERCFYCRRSIGSDNHLDHFISWSRYPHDLGHNFVLADQRCNSEKSDLLADPGFHATWRERNRSQGSALAIAFEKSGVPSDLVASERIADWAYSRADQPDAVFWRPGLPR